jgi:transmembrane sensor
MKQYWKDLYQLLNRYLSGKASAYEHTWMDTWYDSIDNKPEAYEDKDVEMEMWTHIEANMDATSHDTNPNVTSKIWNSSNMLRVAACLVLLSTLAFYGLFSSVFEISSNTNHNIPQEYISYKNNEKVAYHFFLPDSSSILLEPGSSISYPKDFDDSTRLVYLTGEAFFDITPNPIKPFIVQTATLATRVLGTSFIIKEDLSSHQIEVSVTTGVVEVIPIESKSKHHKLLLTANKKATYLIHDDILISSIVDEPQIIHDHAKHSPPLPSFHYKEAPLQKILSELSKSYGVTIALEDKSMEQFLINADLSQEKTLFSQLDILCAALNLAYEVKVDKVYLTHEPIKNSFK